MNEEFQRTSTKIMGTDEFVVVNGSYVGSPSGRNNLLGGYWAARGEI